MEDSIMHTKMGITINGLPLYMKRGSGETTRVHAADLRLGETFSYTKDGGSERYLIDEIWLDKLVKVYSQSEKAKKCKGTVSVGVGYKRRPCRSWAHHGYDGYCQAHWQSVLKERIFAVGEFLLKRDKSLFGRVLIKARESGRVIR